jgi:autotransporter translocation and assembly factor TamB
MFGKRRRSVIMETVPFIVSDNMGDDEVKGLFSPNATTVIRHLSTEQLQKNLNTVCKGLSKVFKDIHEVGQFKLKEVTIQVEITAEGGVNLIGSATIGGKGAITLKFAD